MRVDRLEWRDGASRQALLVLGLGLVAGLGIATLGSRPGAGLTMVALLLGGGALGGMALVARIAGDRLAGTRSVFVWLLFLGVVLWGAAQLLHAVTLFDEGLRYAGYRWKNLLGAVVVASIALGCMSATLARRDRWAPGETRMLVVAVAFPLFALVSTVIRGDFSLQLMAMYALWMLYAFVVGPRLTADDRRWRTLLLLGWGGTWVVLLGGILAGIATGQLTWLWTERYAFAFALVPYAFGVQVAGWLGFTLSRVGARGAWRWLHLGSLGLAVVLLLAANSRGALLFLITALAVYRLTAGRRWLPRSVAAAALVGLLLVTGLHFSTLRSDEIDRWSSGRLELFELQFVEHLRDHGLAEWLTGSPEFVAGERTLATTDAVSEEARFQRNNTDNAYLSIVLHHGLLGLALFSAPFVLRVRSLIAENGRLRGDARRRARIGLATIAGLTVQSLVSMTVPSMGNVLAIYLPLLWGADALVVRSERSGVAEDPR